MSSTSSDDSARPVFEGGDAIAHRRDVLYRVLANNATPVVLFPNGVRSAASLWAGTREWTRAFRSAGVEAGQVVASVLPTGDALLQLLIACLWDDLSLLLLDAEASPHALRQQVVAHEVRLLIGAADRALPLDEPWCIRPATGGWPEPGAALPVRHAPRTGPLTGGAGVRGVGGIPLTHDTLLQQARQVAERFALHDACVCVIGARVTPDRLAPALLAPLLHASELLLAPTIVDAVHLVDEAVTHVLVDRMLVDEAREQWPRLRLHGIEDGLYGER